LPEDGYHKERQAFFGSIGKTLNHILVGDRLWLSRFIGHSAPFRTLDAIPYPERLILWGKRQELDQEIMTLFSHYNDDILKTHFSYEDTEGTPQSIPAPIGFGQFFNHQTHHRGQVHNMLSIAGTTPPPLDFSYFYFESKG